MARNEINSQSSDSDEYIEDEMFVYVDIEPTSLAERQIRNASCFNIVGTEKSAIIQCDNKFFEGQYDYSMGTHVFFEKDEEAAIDPLYTRCENYYKFNSQTNKTLKMSRVLLKDPTNEEEALDETQAELVTDEEVLKTTRTYEEALNLFLPPTKKVPPRKIKDDGISMEIIEKMQTSKIDSDEKEMD